MGLRVDTFNKHKETIIGLDLESKRLRSFHPAVVAVDSFDLSSESISRFINEGAKLQLSRIGNIKCFKVFNFREYNFVESFKSGVDIDLTVTASFFGFVVEAILKCVNFAVKFINLVLHSIYDIVHKGVNKLPNQSGNQKAKSQSQKNIKLKNGIKKPNGNEKRCQYDHWFRSFCECTKYFFKNGLHITPNQGMGFGHGGALTPSWHYLNHSLCGVSTWAP